MLHSTSCISPKLSLASSTLDKASKVVRRIDKERSKFKRELLIIINSISAQLECLGCSLHTLTSQKRIEVEAVMIELSRKRQELLGLL